jgi:gamma-glutamyltranspeptidase
MIDEAVIAELEKRGHKAVARKPTSHHGDAHSIAINVETGEFHGVADWRKNGEALAY